MERAAFRKKQRRPNVWRLIFVDEFGIHRAMSRIYARAPRGERARVKEPTDENRYRDHLVGSKRLRSFLALMAQDIGGLRGNSQGTKIFSVGQ